MKIKRIIEREIEIDTDGILERVKEDLENSINDILFYAIQDFFVGDGDDWDWLTDNGYDKLWDSLANSIEIKITPEKVIRDYFCK